MWHKLTVLRLVMFVFISAGLSNEVFGATAYFQGLGDLPGGEFDSYPGGISADGSVVVGGSTSASGREAFYWTLETGMVGLGDLAGGDFSSGASMVSGDGSVIIGRGSTASGKVPLRWTAGTGMVELDLGGGEYEVAIRAMSDDGLTLVGSRKSALGTEAFRYTEADGMVGLGDLPGGEFNSYPYGISADGSVIVGGSSYSDPDEHYEYYAGFRWTEDTGMVNLHFASAITGLSADGSTIVGYYTDYSGFYPFRWTDSLGYVGLHSPGSAIEFSRAFDVSGDGSVIVGDSFVDGPPRAAIWDEVHGARYLQDILTGLGLDLTGWELYTAYSVSDDGLTIVGSGTNPDGNEEAFIAVIPEPGMMLISGAGVLALFKRRVRGSLL